MSAVPGLTQLTRMPSRTWSAAIARVSESTAPLLALYRARCGSPAVAAMEQVWVIDTAPGRSAAARRRWGRACRAVRTMPRTLMSRTRVHSSSALSSTVPMEPICGVGDDGVQCAQFGGGPVDRLAHRVVVGDVRLDGEYALGGARGLPVQYGHPGAARQQHGRDGGPDAGGAAGDQGSHSFEVVRSGHRPASSVVRRACHTAPSG